MSKEEVVNQALMYLGLDTPALRIEAALYFDWTHKKDFTYTDAWLIAGRLRNALQATAHA